MLTQLPFEINIDIFKFLELPILCKLSSISTQFNTKKHIQVIYQTNLSKKEYINIWLTDYSHNIHTIIVNIKNIIINIQPPSYYNMSILHQQLYSIYNYLDNIKYYSYIKYKSDQFNKNIKLYKCIKHICEKREMPPNKEGVFNIFRSILLILIYILDNKTIFNNTNVDEFSIYNFYNMLEQNMTNLISVDESESKSD